MTHIPSGKIYVGSLKNDSKWTKYCTSSKLVKEMMKANPEDWKKEILLKDFAECITFSDVVSLEQSIIKYHMNILGIDMLFNKGYFSQQRKLYGRGLPKSAFKKDHKPWNAGKTNVQKSDKKGKTFAEIYGEERAKEILKRRQESRGTNSYRKKGDYVTSEETKQKIRDAIKRKHATKN